MFLLRAIMWLVSLPIYWAGWALFALKIPLCIPLLRAAWRLSRSGEAECKVIQMVQLTGGPEAALAEAAPIERTETISRRGGTRRMAALVFEAPAYGEDGMVAFDLATSPETIAAGATVNSIDPSMHAGGRVDVAADNYRQADAPRQTARNGGSRPPQPAPAGHYDVNDIPF